MLICRSDCLKVTSFGNAWNGCRANSSVTGSGRFYYECTIQCKDNGICRIGWNCNNDRTALGSTATSYGFGGTGKKANNNVYEDYGESFSSGDVIGYFDF